MGARVIIEWEGLEETISYLSALEDKIPHNLETQTKELATDTERVWKQATPRKSGRLQEGDNVEPDGMSFTLNNSTKYYPFVSDGHNTPRGWRTKHGYRAAKRRSYVQGKHMTEKATEFIEQNIQEYLSKFLDNT